MGILGHKVRKLRAPHAIVVASLSLSLYSCMWGLGSVGEGLGEVARERERVERGLEG